MKISASYCEDGNFYLIQCRGEIDFESVETFRVTVDQMLDKGCDYLVFNLKEVGFVNSLGLSVIGKAYRTLRERDGRVAIITDVPEVLDVFKTIGFTKIMYFYRDLQEMLSHIRG